MGRTQIGYEAFFASVYLEHGRFERCNEHPDGSASSVGRRTAQSRDGADATRRFIHSMWCDIGWELAPSGLFI